MSEHENSIIDSHCHIVFSSFDEDRDKVAERWRKEGVKALLHACVEPSEIPAIKLMADQFQEMRYSVGVHPLDVHNWKPQTLDLLKNAALDDSRVVAIGELGLDLFKAKTTFPLNKKLFTNGNPIKGFLLTRCKINDFE